MASLEQRVLKRHRRKERSTHLGFLLPVRDGLREAGFCKLVAAGRWWCILALPVEAGAEYTSTALRPQVYGEFTRAIAAHSSLIQGWSQVAIA